MKRHMSQCLLSIILILSMISGAVDISAMPQNDLVATSQSTYLSARKINKLEDWLSFFSMKPDTKDMASYQSSVTKTGYIKVGRIHHAVKGTLFVQTYANVDGKEVPLVLKKSTGGSLTQYCKNGILMVTKLSAGDYGLYTKRKISSGSTVTAVFAAGSVSVRSGRTVGSDAICSAGTGKTMYQNFTMKNRGLVSIQAYGQTLSGTGRKVPICIQKKIYNNWVKVSATVQASKATNYVSYFGLNAGSYRIVYNTYEDTIYVLKKKETTADSSYGATKLTAKTIGCGSSSSQIFLESDPITKAHWYKIKLTKSEKIILDIKNLGTNGTIYFTLYGPKKLTMSKTTTGICFSGTGTKGTYYIKVYKSKRAITGGYRIKYTK